MMEASDGRGKKHIQRCVNQVLRLMIKISLEVVADLPNQHFFLIAGHRHIAGVLLKKDDRIIQSFFF